MHRVDSGGGGNSAAMQSLAAYADSDDDEHSPRTAKRRSESFADEPLISDDSQAPRKAARLQDTRLTENPEAPSSPGAEQPQEKTEKSPVETPPWVSPEPGETPHDEPPPPPRPHFFQSPSPRGSAAQTPSSVYGPASGAKYKLPATQSTLSLVSYGAEEDEEGVEKPRKHLPRLQQGQYGPVEEGEERDVDVDAYLDRALEGKAGSEGSSSPASHVLVPEVNIPPAPTKPCAQALVVRTRSKLRAVRATRLLHTFARGGRKGSPLEVRDAPCQKSPKIARKWTPIFEFYLAPASLPLEGP